MSQWQGRAQRRLTSRALWPICVLAVCVLTPGVAAANPFDIFGAGSRAGAMGGAMTAGSNDFSAVYYNVGAMGFQDATSGVGFTLSVDNALIRLKARPDGYELPNLGRNSAAVPSEFRLRPRTDTEGLLDTYGVYAGGVTSLGFDDLRLGMVVFFPVNRLGLQVTHFPDEREQYFTNQLTFELLGARVQRQVIMLGAAYRLADWLSVGAGISFLPTVRSANNVYLDNPTDQSDVELVLDTDQTGRVAPSIGAQLILTDDLQVGLNWRGEHYFVLKGRNEVQIRGFQEIEDDYPVLQEFSVVQNFTPHQLSLGTSYKLGEQTLATLDLVYMVWSRYLNNQGARVESFEDTTSMRIGAEHKVSDAVVLRAGFGFEPTPVPAQTGRTNYVDNDRVVFSLGMGHALDFLDEQPVELSWYMQLQYLIPQDTDKDLSSAFPACEEGVKVLCDELPDDLPDPVTGLPTPENAGLQTGNPGFPGFQSYGQILTVGLDLRWRY